MKDAWEAWHRRNNVAQLLHIYIPSDCSNSQNYSDGLRSPLNKAVQDFLVHKKQKVLLVLGDSGSGKTSLTLKLEEEYWNGHSEVQYIPIRIELRSFTKETIKICVEETLKNQYKLSEEEIEQLKKNKNIPLIFLFDGYDEIGGRAEFNLYDESGLRDWDCEIKIIITCRSQHFTSQSEFEDYFVLNEKVMNTKLREGLKLIYIAPFSEEQMKQYLVQYSEEHAKKKNTVEFPLEVIQELLRTQSEFKSLLSNPFVLRIFSDVAPKFLSAANSPKTEKILKINRAEIYQAFLEDWFSRARDKLESSINKSNLNKQPQDIEKYFFVYAQRLAFAYFREGITELKYEEVSSDEDQPEEYRVIQEGNSAFKEFFGSENPEVVEARKACPLRRSGECAYSFVHKSFQDYLVARHLYLVLKSGNKKLTLENWNIRYLSKDRAILRVLSELLASDSEKQELEERLIKIIKKSSQRKDIEIASSNAISVLNWNRYSFSEMDLRGIRIPKAYLDAVNFSGANLSRSKLSGSYVRNSEWSEANLRGSDLRGLEFGEYPDWEQKSEILCLAFNAKGTMVATGDNKGALWLWSYPEGNILKVYQGHTKRIRSIAFSPNGKWLASGSGDETILIWNIKSEIEEKKLIRHTGCINSVSWSSDGQRLASGSDDTTIRIWNVKAGTKEKKLKGHESEVISVSWSLDLDGKWLASGSNDKTIRIWRVESGVEERILRGHTNRVTSVSWSRDGKHLASGSGDGTIRLWNTESGKQEKVLGDIDNSREINSVSFSSDGNFIASAGKDTAIYLWDVQSGVEKQVLRGHKSSVAAICFSLDGKRLMSGSYDNTIRLWNIENTGEEQLVLGHANGIRSNISVSKDEKYLASGGVDKTIRVWDLDSGQEKQLLMGHEDIIRSVSFSPDGKYLASGSQDNTMCLWDIKNEKKMHKLEFFKNRVNTVSFSDDGRYLAGGSADKQLLLWDIKDANGEVLWNIADSEKIPEPKRFGNNEWVNCVIFSSTEEQRYLASGNGDCMVCLWDLNTSEKYELKSDDVIREKNWINSVSFSGNGERLASGSNHGDICLWDITTKKLIKKLNGKHTQKITSVSFSSDGEYLASGSWDRTIKLWRVKSESEVIHIKTIFLASMISGVTLLSKNQKEKCLVASDVSGGIYLFSAPKTPWDENTSFILKWRTRFYLRAQGANLENAEIGDVNRRLLEQRGAKKSHPNHEADEERNKPSQSLSQNTTQKNVSSSSHSPKQAQSNSTPTYLSSAMHGDFETMQSLYNSIMNVNFGNETNSPEKRSTLHWACYHRNKKAVKFLLNHHADVNLLDVNKQTPLHLVLLPRYDATNNQIPEDKKIRLAIFSKLLRHRAQIDLKNNHNKTAVDLSEMLALQSPIMEPGYFFLILIQTQSSQIAKLTKLIESIFKIDFQVFKNDISSCLKDYKNPNLPDNQPNNKQLINQILQSLLFIDKIEYNVFQYLAHLRDKGGMVTDVGGKFIPAVIDAVSNSEKIKVVFPKTENGWIQGQSFEGWNNIEFLVARMNVFIQIWLDYKKGFLETGLSDDLKKVFEERLEREIYYGITACCIAQINQQISQLAKDNPLKEKLKVVFNRILCQFISQLPEGHIFYYPTGNKTHSVYVNFKRLPKNQIGIWVDNVGDEHETYGHTVISPEKKMNPLSRRAELSGHKKVLSCSLGRLDVSLFKEHAVDVEDYLENLSEAETEPGRNGLDKVYIRPYNLEVEDYKPEFQAKRELTKGHCVLRNHNVGLLNRFFYRIPEETEDDSSKKPGRVLYRLVKEREELTLLRMK